MSKALQEELEQAIRNGELETIRELVKKGADLQRGLTSGRPALLEACYYRKQDLVEWILNQKVDIDAKDNEGLTALHITGTLQSRPVSNEHLGLVRLLLEKGADVNAEEYEKGQTPLHLAPRLTRRVVVDMMRLLLEAGADPDLEDYEGLTGWTTAVNYSVPQEAIMLLKAADERKKARQAAPAPAGSAKAYDSDEMDAYLDAQEAAWEN